MSADRLSNYLDYKREVEPEFKNDEFEAELLDEQENPYRAQVQYESYSYDGLVRVVSLRISTVVQCQYTLEEIKDIIAERNGKYSVTLECTPIFK